MDRTVKLGVVAMEKKSGSKPMKEIIKRLRQFDNIQVNIFTETLILNEPFESWPECDALLSFSSTGFPLEKAIGYAQLRKPFIINDLEEQITLQDRAHIHHTLDRAGIELPRYEVLVRDPLNPDAADITEDLDSINVNGNVFHKPFVEKPLDAEDHNVVIYYPSSTGGGSQRLFRKIGSRSSMYSPESKVRRDRSYVYEEFTPTDGKDIKVYTVGPEYAHAEARKSPALDGIVERDKDGKEVRYPIILRTKEKLVCRTVVLAFKQNICGFDILRTDNKSYVVDVNGFSFVKNSCKYYNDCAHILGKMLSTIKASVPRVLNSMGLFELTTMFFKQMSIQMNIPASSMLGLRGNPFNRRKISKTHHGEELKCVVAVLRHGDRTPKQKIKVEVDHPSLYELFNNYGGLAKGTVKMKNPLQLQEFLNTSR